MSKLQPEQRKKISDPWTYVLIYLPYFILQAVMMAFLPLYIKELGYSPLQVAVVTAAENIATIFGPPFLMCAVWGSGLMPNIHRRYGLISLLFFLPLLFVYRFEVFFLCWTGVLIFNRTAFGLVNQSALREDQRGSFKFSRVRLWGSIWFICATLCAGVLVRGFSTHVSIWLIFGALIGIFELSSRLGGAGPAVSDDRFKIGELWPWKLPRDAKLFILSVALLWTSHGPYYTFISIHLDRLGWSAPMISVSWSIGVATEVIAFLYYSEIEKRFTQLSILRISLLLTAIRWVLLSISDSAAAILALQTFHAFSFATSYVASMKLIEPLLPDRLKSGSQAVLMAFGTGAGSLIGKFFAGFGASALTGAGVLALYNINAQSEYFILYWASSIIAVLGYLCASAVRDPEPARNGNRAKRSCGVSAQQLPPEP